MRQMPCFYPQSLSIIQVSKVESVMYEKFYGSHIEILIKYRQRMSKVNFI